MRRAAATLLALALLAGCGGSKETKFEHAQAALKAHPSDPAALRAVVQGAYLEASHRYDVDTGGFKPAAKPYLDTAAAVWPRYLKAAGGRASADLALLMVQVYGEGLERPADAAAAAHLAAIKKPTSAAFLQETVWAARAGDRKQARLAGEQALELAAPADRDRVRAGIEQALSNAP